MDKNPIETEVLEGLHTCKSCQNQFEGKFCNQCGEKVVHQNERAILHFLGGVFHIITHADAKIFRTLKLILLNPGMYSLKYAEGMRQRFTKPIPLFFVGNLIYFLFPLFQTFNTSLYSQVNLQTYSESIKPVVERRMADEKMTFEAFAAKYDAKTATFSKMMLILFVPMYSLLFLVLNYRKDRYFADHLLAGLEFMCFTIFYTTILWSFVAASIHTIFVFTGLDINVFESEWTLVMPVVIILLLYFAIRLERTFYKQKWIWAIVKAGAILYATSYMLLAYRYILFHITMYNV